MGIIEKIVLDDATMRLLAESARAHGRSIEEEAADALRRASHPFPTKAEMIAELDRIAGLKPKGVKQTDSVLLLREDRDR